MTEDTSFQRLVQLCSGKDAAQALDPVLSELRGLLQVHNLRQTEPVTCPCPLCTKVSCGACLNKSGLHVTTAP